MMSGKSEFDIANKIKFPDWAPKELVSVYVNSEELDPILKLLLTHHDMELAWELLFKAGMTDSPRNEHNGYTFVFGARKTPMGLYEYITLVRNVWNQKTLLSPSESAEKLSKLKESAEHFVSLIKDIRCDVNHKTVADYAKYNVAKNWKSENRDQLTEHLKTRIDYPEISITKLIQAYIDMLDDPAQTKFYYRPTKSYNDGKATFFLAQLSKFMRDFYENKPLHQVVTNTVNAILGRNIELHDAMKLIRLAKDNEATSGE